MLRKIAVVLTILVPLVILAEKSTDADQQKISDIEQKMASISNFSSPEMTEAMQKYLYDGTVVAIGQFGRLYRTPKAQVLEMTKKPDPSDPDVRMSNKINDLKVDVMGDSAMATYKLMTTETGHKEAVLNGDYSLTCLDTFVKHKGQWYVAGTACVPATPLSQMQWDAIMKMRAEEKP